MKKYIVTYSIYEPDEGLYTEAVVFDNEADADSRFNEYILNEVMESFNGTKEEFDREFDSLLQIVMPHPSGCQGKILKVEIDETAYCVCVIEA